jgi:hypothetical protein
MELPPTCKSSLILKEVPMLLSYVHLHSRHFLSFTVDPLPSVTLLPPFVDNGSIDIDDDRLIIIGHSVAMAHYQQ